jgi:hypothetical protein
LSDDKIQNCPDNLVIKDTRDNGALRGVFAGFVKDAAESARISRFTEAAITRLAAPRTSRLTRRAPSPITGPKTRRTAVSSPGSVAVPSSRDGGGVSWT